LRERKKNSMSAINQWYELVATEYSRIEELKEEYMERGEIIHNLTAALLSGEIDQETYDDLLARVCGESE